MIAIDTALEHPLRRELNDEVHARPPDSLPTPCAVTYIARLPRRDPKSGVGKDLLGDLLKRHGQERPDRATNHFSTRLGPDHLRWERHTEPFYPPLAQVIAAAWFRLTGGMLAGRLYGIIPFALAGLAAASLGAAILARPTNSID